MLLDAVSAINLNKVELSSIQFPDVVMDTFDQKKNNTYNSGKDVADMYTSVSCGVYNRAAYTFWMSRHICVPHLAIWPSPQ